MPLSSKDIHLILNLLNEDTCGTLFTFEKISDQFEREVSKCDFLPIGNALLLLLQNRDLTSNVQQRLIIYFLFFIMYPSDEQSIDSNPFAPVFLSILRTSPDTSTRHYHWMIPSVTSQERSFVRLLLTRRIEEILPRTPNQYLQQNVSLTDSNEEKRLKEKLDERAKQWPISVQCHLPAVINDPEMNPCGFDTLISGSFHRANDHRQTIEELLRTNSMEKTICPEYLRLVPPLHECQLDELIWLEPVDQDDGSFFIWDPSMCTIGDLSSEFRLLIDRACQGLLNLQLQQRLIEEIKQNSDQTLHLALSPRKFPSLVEHYPVIAIECLLKFHQTHQINDYLATLVKMETSVHSMEVVNRLSTMISLPGEFLHLYISACIVKCQETKEKALQHRFVRLVSVFIQSLIRNKAIDVKDCHLPVQEFALNFRRIKEASSLYQLLQTFGFAPDEHDDSTRSSSHVHPD